MVFPSLCWDLRALDAMNTLHFLNIASQDRLQLDTRTNDRGRSSASRTGTNPEQDRAVWEDTPADGKEKKSGREIKTPGVRGGRCMW